MSAWLAALGVETLAHPSAGWIGAALAVAALFAMARSAPAALEWPGGSEVRQAGATRRDLVARAALALRAGSLLALAAVLAGPTSVHRAPPEPGYGLDLTLVVDASGSMRALDARVGDAWRTRLDLAREVVARFASQRAAEGDRVALVVFGDSAFTQCPLTSDGALLSRALDRVEAGMAGEATALGQALALAVKRSLGAAQSPAGAPGAGRVVVLLTDGRHNAGPVSVELATQLAAAAGVRVHTVGIGSSGDLVAIEGPEGPGGALHFERHDVDVKGLEAIARATGGRFFAAHSSRDLDAVYDAIDHLERVARPRPSRVRRSEHPEPLLAVAAGFLLAETALARVARRRLP